MADPNKINIKLELSRDKDTGKFSIIVHFDSKASNFSVDKNNYTWIPTTGEKDLINEAFRLVSDKEPGYTYQPEPIKTNFKEKIKEISNEKIEEDVENNLDEKVEFTEEANDENIIVEASDDKIEEVIQKRIKKDDFDDSPLREADEHTIIDKVLTQKKKGRWKKI